MGKSFFAGVLASAIDAIASYVTAYAQGEEYIFNKWGTIFTGLEATSFTAAEEAITLSEWRKGPETIFGKGKLKWHEAGNAASLITSVFKEVGLIINNLQEGGIQYSAILFVVRKITELLTTILTYLLKLTATYGIELATNLLPKGRVRHNAKQGLNKILNTADPFVAFQSPTLRGKIALSVGAVTFGIIGHQLGMSFSSFEEGIKNAYGIEE